MLLVYITFYVPEKELLICDLAGALHMSSGELTAYDENVS